MDRLAELRERRALTPRALAEMSGVAADTINQIELGHRKARPSTLRKLARALDVEVRELFEEPALSGKAEAPEREPLPEDIATVLREEGEYVLEDVDTDVFMAAATEALRYVDTRGKRVSIHVTDNGTRISIEPASTDRTSGTKRRKRAARGS